MIAGNTDYNGSRIVFCPELGGARRYLVLDMDRLTIGVRVFAALTVDLLFRVWAASRVLRSWLAITSRSNAIHGADTGGC